MTLRELRGSKGVNPSEVARRMGMTPHNIYRFEEQGTTLITTLECYAAAIDCDVKEVWDAARATRDSVPKKNKCIVN